MPNLCVLRSGGDFRPEHAQRLSRMVPDLVCLSDVRVDGVSVIPLLHDWPGWWAKMEIFRPDIDGDVFYLDLDTTVDRMPEMPAETTVLTDFYHPHLIGSGLMFIKQEDKAEIWQDFTADSMGHMARNSQWPNWGDQGFLQPYLAKAARWGDNVKSYKVHGVGADITCYHGKPRPWEI